MYRLGVPLPKLPSPPAPWFLGLAVVLSRCAAGIPPVSFGIGGGLASSAWRINQMGPPYHSDVWALVGGWLARHSTIEKMDPPHRLDN